MAWSWSHTNEAYSNARRNLEEMPISMLREIAAEWRAYDPSELLIDGFNSEKYEDAIIEYTMKPEIPRDILVERIWDKAAEQATCDNGGFSAWMCPFGCGCHTVSFDRER